MVWSGAAVTRPEEGEALCLHPSTSLDGLHGGSPPTSVGGGGHLVLTCIEWRASSAVNESKTPWF